MKEWYAVYLHKLTFVLLYMLFNSLFTFTQLHALHSAEQQKRVERYKETWKEGSKLVLMLACNSHWGCEERAILFLEDFQKLVS
jgi:hypothetical protein